MVLIVLYLPIIKYKCKNRKNKYKVHSAIQNLAGDVVGVMNEKKGIRDSDGEPKNHEAVALSQIKLLVSTKARNN